MTEERKGRTHLAAIWYAEKNNSGIVCSGELELTDADIKEATNNGGKLRFTGFKNDFKEKDNQPDVYLRRKIKKDKPEDKKPTPEAFPFRS